MNKQTLTYELKIKAIIDSAQKDLAGFGQAMNQAWANGEPPKSLLKAMESMRQRLGSLSEIAQKGVVDSSDLAQAEDDYKAFTKTLHSLTVEFGLFTAEQKKAMLSPEEQKAIQGRAEALRKYNEELKRSNDILEKRKPLEKDQKTQSEKVKNLTKKKEDDESAYKNLKEQGGPKFSKESQVYINNQKRILELNEKIKKAQDKVSDGETLGKLGEGKNNEWTRAAESLERYQKELAEIDSEAGKAFYDKELKEYNKSLNELEKNIGFTSTALDEAKKELSGTEEQLKKLKASDPKELFNNLIKQLKDLGVEGIDGATTFEELEKAVTKLNSKALAKVDDALITAKQELLKMGQAAKEAKRGIDESTTAIKKQEAAIAEREAFEGKIKQFLGLAGAVEVMKNAFRNAFATIKELDTTMGEMAVVTDLTVGDYWDQLPEYAKRASELGVSINGAYEAATLYYQQGLKTNEVVAISTETLKMARIAGLSAEDATNKMTAALRGFNMELNETSAQNVADVYSELAAITASDVNEISTAMTKTASIASSAGMEFETTAAFLSQIIETTRESAETAGTAMKTVIARFQELKKDPAEIGEVDGEMVDANKIEGALRSVGVSLRDASGQFRDLDDVFLELAKKWDSLDKNTQRYIATVAAGSRQQSRFIAMMSDYKRTQELVTAANNSAGASNEQFEKTLDTLKTKLTNLKNAWDEFAMGILNSDLVKVGVDILTKFLEIVNKATGSFKGLGGSIVKILSVITMFKLGQKIFDKFKQPLFKFFSDLTKMGYQAGYDAGKAYADGVATAKQEAEGKSKQMDRETLKEKSDAAKNKKNETTGEKTKSKVLSRIGWTAGVEGTKEKWRGKDMNQDLAAYDAMIFGEGQGPVNKNGLPSLSKKDSDTRRQAAIEERQRRVDAVNNAEASYEVDLQAIEKRKAEAQRKLEEANAKLAETENTPKPFRRQKNETDEQFEERKKNRIEKDTKANNKKKAKAAAEAKAAQAEYDAADKAAADLNKNLDKTRKELVDFDETEQRIQERSQQGWEQVGQGVQQLGGSVMAVGIAVSALGGIFDALGMEEVGETFATVGSIMTLLGGAISAIGTLVPIVTKILVASGYSVQSAWWPLLVIGLALAALVGTVMLIIEGVKAIEAAKLENRMKAAAEATEEAKEQAENAKKSYDELLNTKKGYDELQNTLDKLIYGTREWKQALVESNNQVLELLKTYPELSKYLVKGADGRLAISEEGWDTVITQQEKAMVNTQNLVMNRQLNEKELEMEGATEELDRILFNATTYTDSDGVIHREMGSKTTTEYNSDNEGDKLTEVTETSWNGDLLREELEDIYITQNSSLEEQSDEIEELAKKYKVTTQELIRAGNAMAQAKETLMGVAEQTENIARANLTASASEEVTNSKFGADVIDAFATSVGSSAENTMIKERQQDLTQGASEGTTDELKTLAKEYGVEAQMTGDALTDTKKLYAAMAGLDSIEDIPDSIKDNQTEMLKAIAEMDVANDRQVAMEDYVEKLEALSEKSDAGALEATNIAGLLSDGGLGMTREYAETFMADTDGDGQGDTFDKGKVDDQARALGYDSVDDWAKAVNKTTDELYKEIEENVKSSIAANERNFKKLNNVIGTADNKITKFGDKTTISMEGAVGLSEKLLETVQTSSAATTGALKTQLDAALDSVGAENAEKMANILNAMDWQSMADWDGLREVLEAQGIAWNDTIASFVENAKIAAQAIDIIDFEALAKSVQSLYNVMRSIKTGEQDRAFDSDTYEQLIAANKDLAKDFTQIGDKFYYLGGSMDNLTQALEKDTTAKLKQAEKQMTGLNTLGMVASDLKIKSGEKELDLNKGYGNWSDVEKREWLSNYAQTVGKDALAEGGDAQIFSYLADDSGKSLGMSLGMNVDAIASTKLDQYLDVIADTMNDAVSGVFTEEQAKMQSDGRVSNYTRDDVAINFIKAQEAFQSGDDTVAYERSKAMAVQAVESGMVSEATNSEYAQLLEKLESGDFTGTSKEAVEQRLRELQGVMVDNMQNIIYNQEGVSDIIQLQNDVAQALLDARQKEIDKLSDINDSINSAQEEMVSKVQEQIDDARQARENEKQEKAIADQQSQMTYLMASSNGGGMLEAMALQQNIQDAQEAYGDSLIDQSLQQLSDDNAAAAEQRERQITLLEAQLAYDQENGEITRQAEEIVNQSLDQINTGVSPLDTKMGKLITGQESWENLSSEQYGQQMNELMATSAGAADQRARMQKTEEEIQKASEESAKTEEKTNEEIDGEQLNATTLAIRKAFEEEYGVRNENGEIIQTGNKQKRADAVTMAASAVQYSGGGFRAATGATGSNTEANAQYTQALNNYIAAGGDEASFKSSVQARVGEVTTGIVESVGFGWNNVVAGNYDQNVTLTVGGKSFAGLEFWDPSENWEKKTGTGTKGSDQDKQAIATGSTLHALNNASQLYTGKTEPKENSVGVHNGVPYIYRKNKWRTLFLDSSNLPSSELATAIKSELNAYKKGGLADFTGPAWLDGTKAHPELVLNARDTQNFIQLKDILADILDGTNHTTNNSQNKQNTVSTIDIDINVESIGDDYDVEQLADKIRSMLYDDATYRNVNTISLSH